MVDKFQQIIDEPQALIEKDPDSDNVSNYTAQIKELEQVRALKANSKKASSANQEESQDNLEFPIDGPGLEELPQSKEPKGKGFSMSNVARGFVYIISFKWLIQLFSKVEQSIQLGISSPKPKPAILKVENPTFEPIPLENTAEIKEVTFNVFKEQLAILQDSKFYNKEESIQKIAVETVAQYMNEKGHDDMGFDYPDQATKILDLTNDFYYRKSLKGEDRKIKGIDEVLKQIEPNNTRNSNFQ